MTTVVPEQRAATRERVADALAAAMSAEDVAGVRRCAERLHAELPDRGDLGRNVVLVAYGGGKDSSYMLAFVRAVQLRLFASHGSTFRMRVATNRHAGMPQAVLDNVDRVYRALGVVDDPDCELLLVDGHEVRPFAVDAPLPAHVLERNRLDILMGGHRTGADGRPTFCNACNLSMVNSFGVAAGYGGGVDVIVTGDSQREQRAYRLWVHKLARRVRHREEREAAGFKGFLAAADAIAGAYFTDLYGDDEQGLVEQRRISTAVRDGLRFFSVYDDTHYDSGSHWELLTDVLGFRFDELAFTFTESDCGNPAIMAHLRGLKAERVFGRSYAEGIAEYVEFATGLMRAKEFPEHLVTVMRERYGDPAAVDRMRGVIAAYAWDAYRLTDEHLVCLAHAPFLGKGEGLARYLATEQPALAARADDLHALLAGDGDPADGDAAELAAAAERFSGLRLRLLRTLYLSSPYRATAAPGEPGDDLIGAILAGDPHKAVIETTHTPDGPAVLELLSGR